MTANFTGLDNGPQPYGRPPGTGPVPSAPAARPVERTGWHGTRFVLTDETLGSGAESEPLHFVGELPDDGGLAVRGDVERWQVDIGRHCPGHARPLFAVAVALAAPGAALVGNVPAGGFHLHGASLTGKGLLLRLAASVYGGAVLPWHTLDGGLEAVAAAGSDLPLILDDASTVDPAPRARTARALVHGSGKARTFRNGDPRIRLTWRLFLLSAGAAPLSQRGAADDCEPGACLARHIVELPADAGRGFGIFDGPGRFDNAAALAAHLQAATLWARGALGRAWLGHLTAQAGPMALELRERMARFRDLALIRPPADDIERTTVERFALVAAAGEAATDAGLTGWPAGQAQAAALVLLGTWRDARRATAGKTEGVTR